MHVLVHSHWHILLRVRDRKMLDTLENRNRGYQELDVALLLVVLSPLLT